MLGIGLKAVFFNNNGTGLDDLPSVAYPSMCQTFKAYCLRPPTMETYRNEITSQYWDFYSHHGFKDIPYVAGDDINKIRRRYYDVHRFEATYRPDFEPLLKDLKARKVILGICSGEVSVILQECIARAGLQEYFPEHLVRAQCWSGKASALRDLVKQAGIRPDEAAYVDDTADGVCAALEAGLVAIGFGHPTGYNSISRIQAARPHYLVGSFTQLRRLLMTKLLVP